MRQGAEILLNTGPGSWPRVRTAALWVAAFLTLGLTWKVMTTPPSLALQPMAPEWLADRFNLFIIIGWPFEAVVLLAAAILLWAVSRWTPTPTWRATGIALVLLAALSVPGFLFSVGDLWSAVTVLAFPGVLLIYVAPLLACAVYAGFAPRPTLLRVLGVMALAGSVGLLLYVAGWSLLCGETD